VVLTLAVDAVVHARLAEGYQNASPGGIGTGTLFRLEAIAAALAGLWVLWRGSRAAYAAAATVALSAGAAVVLYRYVNVPAFGPLPAMYEPVWYFQKALSAVAEVVGGIAAAGCARRGIPGPRLVWGRPGHPRVPGTAPLPQGKESPGQRHCGRSTLKPLPGSRG
jgi:hypothetical protein